MQKTTKLEYIHHIEEWQRVGGTVSSYCAQHGLAKSKFYYYKNEVLEGREADSMDKKFKTIQLPQLITTAIFSIQYANGTTLQIHQMIDVAILKTLLHAVS
jgi:hypothetical protein